MCILVPGQEIRTNPRSRWMVESRLVYQGPLTYVWAQRIARGCTHILGICSLYTAYIHARRCILSSIGCTGLRDKMGSCGQYAVRNASVIEDTSIRVSIVYKYFVICVGIFLPVQEIRPCQRWTVKVEFGINNHPLISLRSAPFADAHTNSEYILKKWRKHLLVGASWTVLGAQGCEMVPDGFWILVTEIGVGIRINLVERTSNAFVRLSMCLAPIIVQFGGYHVRFKTQLRGTRTVFE